MKYAFLLFGGLFGFFLSRAGATTYDFYAKLFLFTDLQLLYVIGVAVIIGLTGFPLMERFNVTALHCSQPIDTRRKPMVKGLIPGSLLFGMGWGIAGACPGTALAMLGEGKIAAIVTVAGILIGTFLYGHFQHRKDVEKVQENAE